ncbi:MAG: phenylalanine--tRNA ligase subunit beta [Candidatus Woesearchaeota archaeon]
MVTLDTRFTRLQSFLHQECSLEELEHILFELGFELDDVQGDDIKIDITPDRLDALSTPGLARILNAYRGKKYTFEKPQSSQYHVHIDSSVKDVRPKTVCAVIKNVKFTEENLTELIWLQEKLHATIGKKREKAAIGVYPLDKIQFPIQYCAKKSADIRFQPLDGDGEMTAEDILLNHDTGRTYAHLLKDASKYPVFIDAKNNILSLPPIINSETVGRVTTSTTDVFVECSGFDETVLTYILNLVVLYLKDIGGDVYSVHVDNVEYLMQDMPKKIVENSYVTEKLGLSLTAKDIALLLEKMLYTVTVVNTTDVEVQIPPIRHDIWHKVDIVDDVLRAYGINNITPKVPHVATEGKKLPENQLMEELTQQLVGFGLQEIRTLGVTDKADQFEKMCIEPQNFVSLGSTAERSINMLRTSITPELLKCLSQNQNAQHPLHVFEVGDVILPEKKSDVLSKNVPTVSVVCCSDSTNFTQVKQILATLLARFNCEFECQPISHNSFIPGRCAKILVNGKDVGVIGEIHPKVLRNWNIGYPCASFELTVDAFER